MNAMKQVADAIDFLNERIGRVLSWLAVAMVLVQFIVVVMRYVFGVGSIWTQESIVYMHASMFMLLAGYTLLHNAHVRVDIFYREASPRFKAMVDVVGVILFLWPVCYLIVNVSWPYVRMSWLVHEGSKETSGIQAVFLLKSVILAFAALLALQGLSTLIHSLRVLRGLEQPVEEDEQHI